MTQIQPTTEFLLERTEHGEKFHIRHQCSPDFLCHAPHAFSRYEKGPINLDDLCLNCYACNEGFEIVAKKEVEMSNEDRCQKCGVHQDKVKLVSSEHYHSICNPCLEELHQRELSQSSCAGECDHLQFEYEQANEMLCEAQTRIEELEKDRDNWEASSQHNLLHREQLCNENDELQVENSRLDEECSGAKREANEIECKRQYLLSERDELQGQVAYLTAANEDDANLQIAVTALREQVAGLEKENLGLIEDRQGLYEDLEDLNAANDGLNEDEATQVGRVCRLERANHTMQTTIDKLEKREADAYAMFEIENKARVGAVRKVAELEKETQRLMDSDKAMLDTIAKVDREHEAIVAELEKERDDLQDDVERIVGYNQDQVSKMGELEAELNSLKIDFSVTMKSYRAISEATRGHTPENLATMVQAMPPAEELEGYELEQQGIDRDKDGYWSKTGEWIVIPRLVRTPIIEYIPTKEITDELCKELGRIECEVRNYDSEEWNGSFLVQVMPVTKFKYQSTPVGTQWGWEQCRIKAETLKND